MKLTVAEKKGLFWFQEKFGFLAYGKVIWVSCFEFFCDDWSKMKKTGKGLQKLGQKNLDALVSPRKMCLNLEVGLIM